MPGAPDRPDPGPRRLPRGRHGLSRTAVVENQRGRIFSALAAACAEDGYGEVTVQAITARAGVSRRTFYDLFADKQDCFIAAYDASTERLLADVGRAYGDAGRPWPERVAAALRAVIERYVAEPELGRLVTVEVLAAGPAALAHRDAMLRRFAVFLEPGAAGLPFGRPGAEILTHGVIGGLYEALYTCLVEGRTETLPALLPELLYCVLVPYLGHAEALAASQAAGCPDGPARAARTG
jgi:AcrR family transcriptional regulator